MILRKSIVIWSVFTFLAVSGTLKGQTYGNEWINFSQKYFKFKIAEDGIYRIGYQALSDAGIKVNTLNPKTIRMFSRGKEIPVFIQGENDGVFNSNDFIEFYGQKNDGWFDKQMYLDPAGQPNPYYSLVNDTAVYFITWGSSQLNKRIQSESDLNFAGYAPTQYFIKELLQEYHNDYLNGELDGFGGKDVDYVSGEGWVDGVMNIPPGNPVKTKTFFTTNAVSTGPSAILEFTAVGNSVDNSIVNDKHLRMEFGTVIFDTLFEGYEMIKKQIFFPPSLLSSTSSFKFTTVNDRNAKSARIALGYTKLTYPHTTDLENKDYYEMQVPNNPGSQKSYFEFANFKDNGIKVWVYDISQGKRLSVKVENGLAKVLIPNSSLGKDKKCIIFNEGVIKSISKITPVGLFGNFTDLTSTQGDYVIITHKDLTSGALQYESYRKQSFDPVLIYVDELYDQFAYGIEKHPLSIRNFARYALDNWSDKPEYLFLLGKSLEVNSIRNNSSNYEKCLVPTYGSPPSDNLLTAGLAGTVYEPAIATGRLSAQNNGQIEDYLVKVKALEGLTPEPWMKQVLHFGGGINLGEQKTFRNYLNKYKRIIEDTLYGGVVYNFFKNTSAPVQLNISDSLKNLINNGVSLMTFFGHAYAGGFDQSIDEPENYYNRGRYPLILANSCYAGNIHLRESNSVSERFVLIEDRGAIAFIASVSLGIASYLDKLSEEFYRQLGYKNYGMSIGKILQQTHAGITDTTDRLNKSTLLECTLHGDPAIILYSYDCGDLQISTSDVFTSPNTVTTESDTFKINLVVTNSGRSVNDSILIEIQRVFPDQSIDVYETRVPSPLFMDTISVNIPVDLVNGVGLNKFTITVDVSNRIAECNETNNITSFDLQITSSDIVPVYPYEYAIVPGQVSLTASTSDPLAPSRYYIFELDTNDSFSNPLFADSILHGGGLISANLPQTFFDTISRDSVVYFWRVSPSVIYNGKYSWRESSFQFINGKKGWGQAHFHQFKKDKFRFIEYKRDDRKFEFVKTAGALQIRTRGPDNYDDAFAPEFSLDGTKLDYATCGFAASVHIAVLDSFTLEPWNSIDYAKTFGNVNEYRACNTRRRADNYFIFRAFSQVNMDSLHSMLKKIPDGFYIIMYNVYGGPMELWSDDQFKYLESLGSTNVRNVKGGKPYIFFTQKGTPSSTVEWLGKDRKDRNSVNIELLGNWRYGNITSTIIGPSTNWGSLHFEQTHLEKAHDDSLILKAYGIDAAGLAKVLIDTTLNTDRIDILNLYDHIDAKQFPTLKLNAYTRDEMAKTPSQLDRWQVIYDGAPEAALNPSLCYSFYNDTLIEGEYIDLTMCVSNISDQDMDSLLVKYIIENAYHSTDTIIFKRLKPLQLQDTIQLRFRYSTIGLPGLNNLWVEINPDNDQPEQYHFNNLARIPFFVGGDKINPILDVTFDGIHILNQDLVSAKPHIEITLNDENQHLAITDTSKFQVFLSKKEESDKRVYFFQNGIEFMKFTPASLPKNQAHIVLQPDLEDGFYRLRVQASDMSDNISGQFDYVIVFEVKTKSTITEVFNYPNPFSTSTRFVFKLTGSVIPDHFKIQIMTVTGKVVREITRDELGPIRIGRNITEYAWDGTDEFGDRLANGVYLYRVITDINGEAIEKNPTKADFYFKEGWGKMYLMR